MQAQQESFSKEWYVDIWSDFLKRFKRKKQNFDGKWEIENDDYSEGDYLHDVTILRARDLVTLTVDYQDIHNAVTFQGDSIAGVNNEYKYTIYEHLARQVDESARDANDCLRLAVIRMLDDIDTDYRIKYEDIVKVGFSGILLERDIPQINSELLNHYIKIDGVVIFRDDMSKLMHYDRVYTCSLGHRTKTSVNRPGAPQQCSGYDPISRQNEKCAEQYLEENEDLAKKDDLFEVLIQERTDKVADFRSPGMIWCKLIGRDYVNFALQNIRNGDFLSICGIIRAEESSEKSTDKRIKILEYTLQATDIRKRPISDLVQDDPQIRELVKIFVQSETEQLDYLKLVRSVAPDIYKNEKDLVIAEAVLLTCVGADERTNPISGSRTRGEPQIFLCGDPGTAKSTYGKWAIKAVPRAFYNSGDKTSAVSLIGGIKPSHREGKTGKLEIGSYGLGQLVVIDELEKMRYEDLQRLSEPLQDDQSITLAKQGYYKNRDISVATIAFANPVKEMSRWDVTKDIYTNTKLPSWLLERFDAIFIVRDVQDDYTDMAKISFKAKSMRANMRSADFLKSRNKQQFALHYTRTSAGDVYSIGEMKHWIQYVRDTFHPSVWDNQDVLDIIDKFYMQYRRYSIRTPANKEEKDSWTRDREIPAVEMRGYMALCRFAEAHARACHRNYCTIDDAEAAINIIRTSKMSAGLNTNSLLAGDHRDQDPELRELKLQSMKQIKYDVLDRQKTTEGRTFSDMLERISWVPCSHPKCRGRGVIYDGDEGEKCPECLGVGGFRKPFTRNDLFERCSNAGAPIGNKMFIEMFKRAINNGEIVRDTHTGPTALFNNTKSRLEYVMKKQGVDDTTGAYDFLKNDVERETVEGVRQRRLLERHPELIKKLKALDAPKPELEKKMQKMEEDLEKMATATETAKVEVGAAFVFDQPLPQPEPVSIGEAIKTMEELNTPFPHKRTHTEYAMHRPVVLDDLINMQLDMDAVRSELDKMKKQMLNLKKL